MSDEDDDLFADSDASGDTDDLIAESKSKHKKIAKPKKKVLKKKGSASGKRKRIPDADNDSDDDDGPGLFDSDDDDKASASASSAKKKKKGAANAKKSSAAAAAPKKPLSKRERMEALRAKKRQVVSPVPNGDRKGSGDGDDDEDSYNSAEYVRTKEDLDFIDTEGDDADAVAELYAEQNFEDEREAMEDPGEKKGKKIKGAGSSSSRGRSERAILEAEADEDDPILQAVNKLKKKKKVQKKYSELEEEGKLFVAKMDRAAVDDEEAVAQKRPALQKLVMIDEVCETLARRDMHRPLLDQDLLVVCKKWIQPLPNGQLGNITVRQRLMGSVALMTGETGINASDLKRSDFGKVVMSLYMHKSETKDMKRKLRALIDQWSRPIFHKSGNMRDLERVQHSRGDGGLSQISRAHMMEEQSRERAAKAPVMRGHRGGKDQDLNSLIQSGTKGKTESGINRVRIPYSRGFQFSVRPENRTTGDIDKRRDISGPTQDSRGKLSKRMVEKGRTKSKNQRSANISIEGRGTK